MGVGVVLLDVVVASPGGRYVHVHDLLALGLEVLCQHLLQHFALVVGEGDGNAKGHGVAHEVRPTVLAGDGLEGDRQ